MPSVIVVIPTYNEKNNIEELIRKVFALKIPNLKVVVADDNSPDGTAEIVKRLAANHSITLIRREEKMGLGPAYLAAFKETLKEKPDYIIQMDADLSHDPTAIPGFLEKIKKCDLVLGSRYISGGKIENWGIARKLISRFGNIYARIILGLPYRDLTSGFKCYKRETLEKIISEKLSSIGYNFQIETLLAAHKKGFQICEIPISFIERKTGASKFNLEIVIESFFKVLLLKING